MAFYLDDPRERSDGVDATLRSDISIPSSWTPINQPTLVSQTPAPYDSTQHAAPTGKRKRRNPAVAKYLGLTTLRTDANPAQVDTSALPTPTCSSNKPERKRTRKTPGSGKAQQRRRVSDGIRITKPTSKPKDSRKSEASNSEGNTQTSETQVSSSRTFSSNSRPSSFIVAQKKTRKPPHTLDREIYLTTSEPLFSDHESEGTVREKSDQIETENEKIAPALQGRALSASQHIIKAVQYSSDGPTRSTGQDAVDYADDGIDDVFGSIDFKDFTNNEDSTDHQIQPAAEDSRAFQYDDYDSFDDGLEDDDLLTLTADLPRNNGDNATDLNQDHCPLSNASSEQVDSGSDLRSSDIIDLTQDRSPSTQFVPPVTQETRIKSQNADRKPIIRREFPSQVRDRSPIIGLTPNTLLRTCFRIGEAINAGRHAVRDGKNVILELYTRVLSSNRDSVGQNFTFCDLYHTKPPYINAVYDAAIWRSDKQFMYDGGRLLEEMKMCRCIGHMKREGKEWVLVVLSVWEASWEDIAWVEGIVNA